MTKMNPYLTYYDQQVGGLSSFSGVRYQRGHGFFGRLFSGIGSFVKDLAPKIGKRALPSAISLAQDILSGQNVARSAKTRLIEAGRNVADETLSGLKSRVQGGSGIFKGRYGRPRAYIFSAGQRKKRKLTKNRKKVNRNKKKISKLFTL